MSNRPPLSQAELEAVAARLCAGCPTAGVSLSPWAQQLQADAHALLAEVRRLQAAACERAAA